MAAPNTIRDDVDTAIARNPDGSFTVTCCGCGETLYPHDLEALAALFGMPAWDPAIDPTIATTVACTNCYDSPWGVDFNE